MTTISVCMIVRNEENILRQAVESVEGLADEVIIVDTGSTDWTVELAGKLGAHVGVFCDGDRMHKAESRNKAADLSNGDWTVILDADERIADPDGLRQFLETTDATAVYIKLSYMNGDQPTLTYPQMRCWRKGSYEYKYRCHEVPVATDGWGKLAHTDFVWEHRPPPGRGWKLNYSLERLILDVAENPGDARPLYYLGRQYMYCKMYELGIEKLLEYIALAPAGRDVADAWHCIAKCYGGLENKQEQIKHLHLACAAQPQRREWWGELAEIYHADGKDEIATGLLKCALELSPSGKMYTNYHWHGAHIHDLLARCLWKLGKYEEGKTYTQVALDLAPDNERLKKNLLWFKSQLGDMDAFYAIYGPDIHSGCARHKAIADLVEGPRVLDFGCGTGDLLLLLQEKNVCALAGMDSSKVALEMAQERGVTAHLIQGAHVPRYHAYNTIVMSQVLEHVGNETVAIRNAAGSLDDGGLLIVTVPKDGRIPSPDHKREYTEESLKKLLSTVGKVTIHSWAGERDRILATARKR